MFSETMFTSTFESFDDDSQNIQNISTKLFISLSSCGDFNVVLCVVDPVRIAVYDAFNF